MLSQTGFLLSYIKYGDYDAVLHCFTLEKGFQSFFARGIYSKKEKKKAYLLPLNELCFTLVSKHKTGAMSLVSKIELVENPDFYQNIKANAIVFFISDFLHQILRNEGENAKFYQEILFFLNELELGNYRAHFIFLIKILEISGLLPLVNHHIFLDPENGHFSSQKTHHLFSEEISNLWKAIILNQNPYKTEIPAKLKKDFLDSILVYYHYHFTDFRIPDSLEIVQQLFD